MIMEVQHYGDLNAPSVARLDPKRVSSMHGYHSNYHGMRLWSVTMVSGEKFTLNDADSERVFLAAKHISTVSEDE